MTKKCFHPDPDVQDGVYTHNSIPNMVTSTFIGYLFGYIYKLLDPVSIKLVR